jgi:hypothetical protein
MPLLYRDVQVVCAGVHCQRLTPDLVRQLQALGLSRSAYAAYGVALDAVFAGVYCAVAAVLVWRKSAERMALFSALTLVTFGGATFTRALDVLAHAYPAWWWVMASLAFLGDASIVLLLYLFPDGRVVPRWALWLAVPWILAQGGRLFFPDSAFNYQNWPYALFWLLFFGGIAPGMVAQIYRYRRVSSPLQRQQTKVVVFGGMVAAGGYLALTLVGEVFLMPFLMRNALVDLAFRTAIHAVMLLIPLSLGVAILRYRLWDVDLLINQVLVYGALTATLGALYIGSVVGLSALLPSFSGQHSTVAIVISTLVAAALFQPLRRRIQIDIDRRFYRRKYNATQALAAFSARLRDEVDLNAVTADLLAVVDDTMQPAHVALWLREPGRES